MDKEISSHAPFWKLLNTETVTNDPFVTVKTFKQSSQTIYNKTKGGVDGNAQMRAIFRCSGDTLKLEQQLIIQMLRAIAVNSWIACRQLQREDLLRSKKKPPKNSINRGTL